MGSTSSFALRLDDGVDGPVVRIRGKLDLATSPHIRDSLFELTGRVVTLDLSAVTFMDSSGAGGLVEAQKRVRHNGGKLVLYGLGSQPLRLLETLGLDNYFDALVPD